MANQNDEIDCDQIKYVKSKTKAVYGIIIIICVIIFLLIQYFTSIQNNLFTGIIKLEPKSERSKPYLSFKPDGKSVKKSYMILVKDLKFNERIESFVNKKVKVKANIFLHEPNDFDKIDILDISEIN